MAYDIVLAPQAAADLRRLPANVRSRVRDAIERHFRHEPTKTSKSRIKRLRGLAHPQFRLWVDDVRVFYDALPGVVEVLAIVAKAEADKWLAEAGEAEASNSPPEDASDEESGTV